MASCRRPSKNSKSSIKYKWIPLEVEPINPASDAGSRTNDRKSGKESSLRTGSGVLQSTTELLSAVGVLWRAVGCPSATYRSPDSNVKHEENVVCYFGGGREYKESLPPGSQCLRFDLKSGSYLPGTSKLAYERLRELKKILLFGSWGGNANSHLLLGDARAHSSSVAMDSGRTDGVKICRDHCDLVNVTGSMNGKYFRSLRNLVNVTRTENKRTDGSCTVENKACLARSSAAGSVNSNSHSAKYEDSSGNANVDLVGYGEHPLSSLCSADSIEPRADSSESITCSRIPGYSLYADFHIKCLISNDRTFGECQKPLDSCCVGVKSPEQSSDSEDNMLHMNDKTLRPGLAPEDEYPLNPFLSVQEKFTVVFAKKKHALAGALAGTFVSLCLHPVDTVKTVIQARSMGNMSICQTFESIISERGIMGLYRGIASNIASSAPTSAVYTFTYETVKATMLPFLPKEYHSFAHCTAGGCASIATSFIFTPSERIKQQMQVHSHYQNCWNALIGVLGKGGLPSLYAGWGAVLCRNIPHSIIKFYTYERLKQLLLPSSQPDAILNTFQTLVCGGLAGSTAALFTTPFDVVKTRLQTQVPGSLTQYNGVYHALQQIAKHEGLRGLYRGLTPRLAMYVSQGAIFFASYEFIKTLFSLEVPDLHTGIIKNECNVESESASGDLHKSHS